MMMKSVAATFTPDDLRQAPAAPPKPSMAQAEARNQHITALAEAMGGLDRRAPHSLVVLTGFARIAEFLLLCVVGFLVHRLYVAPQVGYEASYFVIIPGIAVVTVAVAQACGAYTIAAFRSPITQGMRISAIWTTAVLAALAVVFFLRLEDTVSRVWLIGWYCVGLGALLAGRSALALITRSMSRSGRLERRTVIVGGGPGAASLLDALAADDGNGLSVVGIFDDREDGRSPDVVANYPKLGNVDDLVELARHTRIDLVIFTLPITAETRLLQMLRKLWVLPIDIRLAAHSNKLRFRPRSYSYLGSVPVLDVFDKPIADWDVVTKTVFDRVVGALALLLLAPVIALAALAVKLDSPGPVFFRQKRYGFNNEPIEVWKLRSMYLDTLDAGATRLVTRGDPRVTRVGRFIRKTSIDELPQLFNVVFAGDLSLVGPRPHAMHAKAADRQYDDVVDGYFARHRVRPGLTGWAQVNGWRGETDTQEKIQRRVEHDLAYIENWSILFDIYILLITPFALMKTDNAY